MFMYFDPVYLLVALPGLLLSLWASYLTKTTFKKYAKKRASSGYTGAEAAQHLLESQNIYDVKVEQVEGFLSDHYDPTKRVLRLSPDVYQSPSLSAIGVACHEAGHALQHAHGYKALTMRTALVPLAQVGSQFSYMVIIAGFILSSTALHQFSGFLINLGIALFSLAVLFTVVTLPVEWNASARAKKYMVSCGIVTEEERDGAAAVLNAAFLTYVAAAISSVMTLLYYIMRSRR